MANLRSPEESYNNMPEINGTNEENDYMYSAFEKKTWGKSLSREKRTLVKDLVKDIKDRKFRLSFYTSYIDKLRDNVHFQHTDPVGYLRTVKKYEDNIIDLTTDIKKLRYLLRNLMVQYGGLRKSRRAYRRACRKTRRH
jgi:hypothetical protein